MIMFHFNAAFINFTWVLLPVVVFLIYEVYNENINKKKNDLALEFCLFSSLYLMFRFGSFSNVYILQLQRKSKQYTKCLCSKDNAASFSRC